MKKLISRFLGLFDLILEKSVDKKSIISLIQSLHVFSTDKNLIRLGPDGDGGYLVPNDLEGIEACFSPGVGNLSGFEKDCLTYGMKVFLADGSVNAPAGNEFDFIKKFIGPVSGNGFITLEDWIISKVGESQSDLLLQMDIEGHEYLTLINAPESLLNRFRIIVVEFHSLQKLGNGEFFSIVSSVTKKMLKNHTCVHNHPNNHVAIDNRLGIEIPPLLELTFLRNDRITQKILQKKFPHPLDSDSTNAPHISLPPIWYEK
ncbi:MAG: hypothetical protein AAF149_11160 [Bacteroidota bacterium]